MAFTYVYENFHISHFQNIIVSAETINGNTVFWAKRNQKKNYERDSKQLLSVDTTMF